MSLHKRIKFYREERGLTQENVAAALGIKVPNYAKYESGERNPKQDRIIELAKIFGVGYSNLLIGEERIVVDLLNSHIRSAVVGNLDSFNSFTSDLSHHYEGIFRHINNCLSVWDEAIKNRYSEFHRNFLDEPNLSSLVELSKRYKIADEFNSHYYEMHGIQREMLTEQQKFNDNELDDRTMYKMAFCIAAEKYIDLSEDGSFSSDFIFSEVRNYLEKHKMNDMEALQSFAVLVFVPFLALILDSLEFITDNDSNITDFANAFLYYSLTPDEVEAENTWVDVD